MAAGWGREREAAAVPPNGQEPARSGGVAAAAEAGESGPSDLTCLACTVRLSSRSSMTSRCTREGAGHRGETSGKGRRAGAGCMRLPAAGPAREHGGHPARACRLM